MKSPFPGMDPYLEGQWREVHHNLISFAQAELQSRLPGDLRARIGERVFVESLSGGQRGIFPDVYVVERPTPHVSSATTGGGVLMAEPFIVTLSDDPVTQGYIEIREAGSGGRIITVIEFVSPTNKLSGAGRSQYLQKQEECLSAGINLVEIDLIRRGEWVLSVPESSIPSELRATYQICVCRGPFPNKREVYSAPLRERLPAIPIPLREDEPDVPLDLQALIDRCYQQGNYGVDIDYQAEPEPPLGEADARWADELLRQAARR